MNDKKDSDMNWVEFLKTSPFGIAVKSFQDMRDAGIKTGYKLLEEARYMFPDFVTKKTPSDPEKSVKTGKVFEDTYEFLKNMPPDETAKRLYEYYFGNSKKQPQTENDNFYPSLDFTLTWPVGVEADAAFHLHHYSAFFPEGTKAHSDKNGTYFSVPGTKNNPKELRCVLDGDNIYFAKQDAKDKWQYLQKIPSSCPDNTNPVEFYMTVEKMVDYFRNMPAEQVEKYREHFKAWIPHSDEIFTLGAPDKMFDGFMKVVNKWEKSLKETPAKTKAPAPKGKEPAKKAAPAPAKRAGTSR